ncbi:hypothetical protein NAEGRDRAFT_80521 [Naegleria gruberi]|uniref:Uncharacterized protein n=1 Tax=Naegleria gruberi TaxID=5762 RepID=D2VMA3_NAEGR|nr:uncharacterized protein NAEGRDRAFT_80521 [Naegleria gruberi]EFC41953.1 hypothetical protein NAEGRDRAFT_80521 [Naegleria gruberi]|eukprot:XP_002674697.1 hypothetical protein NAEGRDRAFT_80521 [Naegleria gruberi strain NEG-M]
MEETVLINGNRKANSLSTPFAKGKCVFFTFSAVGVLLCVISSLVLNSIIFNMLNGSNSHQVISYNSTEFPSLTVQHVASELIKKGQPVGTCSYDLGKVCPIELRRVLDSILQTLKTTQSNSELISHVSDVSMSLSILIQHIKQGNSQKIIFNGIVSNFPIVYYSIESVDILQAIGEKPLEVNESFKLMGAKIIYYEADDDEATSRSVVTFVRSSPTNEGTFLHQFKTVLLTINQNQLKSTINVDNSTVGFNIDSNLKVDDEFNVKYFSIGMTDSDSPVITLYFNSVSKGCQASVISVQNNKLNTLNSLQQGPTNVGCNTGLKSFTYDSNTILILSAFSLAAITVNSQSGALTTKSLRFSYTSYRGLEFQRKISINFIGNDMKPKKGQVRSSKFFIIYSNEANGFSQVMPITFNGNEFDTARIIPFSKSMKNIQGTYFDTSNINLIFQQDDEYKSMKVTFTNEKEQSSGNTYLIETPIEGIELSLKSISPLDWLIRAPPTSLSDNFIISLLVDPNSLDFQLGQMSSLSTVNFIGLALQDAKSGDKLHIMSEGLTPLGTFDNDQLIPGMEYYVSGSNGISLEPSSSSELKVGKAISSSQLIIYKRS